MYGVCNGLRYKMMQPTVRREDLLNLRYQLHFFRCIDWLESAQGYPCVFHFFS